MTNYSRSVLKSNGFHHSENLPVKFVFSSKTVPANIAQKLPSQRCSQPFLIPLFNFSHKRPTFAFTGESGYTLAFRRKIAHKGPHGETGVFPSAITARLCAASEIALNAAFATLDSAMLLYTYISRFSVNPHGQQREKIRQSYSHKFYPPTVPLAFFNFSHKRPTFAFTCESGYTLGFAQRIAHNGPHAETGAFPPSATVRLCAASEIAAERTAGGSGCTSVACVRFLRRRGPAWLRNTLFDLPMLHFSRSAHGDFCACEIGVVSLPPRTVNKTAHICFHS